MSILGPMSEKLEQILRTNEPALLEVNAHCPCYLAGYVISIGDEITISCPHLTISATLRDTDW